MDGPTLLPEFDHEFALTRKALDRIPAERLDWRPHEKSFTLHDLAAHLAEIPTWTGVTLETELFDMDEPRERVVPEGKDDILRHFDANVAAARRALEGASGERLAGTWSLKYEGEVRMSMPRAAVVRSFVLNHNVHHRAQLGVYLRLLGVAVPAVYGPSADEQPEGM